MHIQISKHILIDLSKEGAADTIYASAICEWHCDVVILVNCAGFGMTGEFLNHNVDRVRTMVNVNAMCCIELAHKFGRYFVQKGRGRICQIASVAAFVPGAHAAVYHGTKAFIRNWAIALQHELIGTGVGVTVIDPGPVRTHFVEKSNSEKSLVFGAFRWFTYESVFVANAAVNATLNGDAEVVYGPLWRALQCGFLSFYGEMFNVISCKHLWQDPESKYRSPFEVYKHE